VELFKEGFGLKEQNTVKKDPTMESVKLSYRVSPVYVAISLAFAAPFAQADCSNGSNNATCYSFLTNSQNNFDLIDTRQSSAAHSYSLAEWSPSFISVSDNAINAGLDSYALQITNSSLALALDDSADNKGPLSVISRADATNDVERTLVINGHQSAALKASAQQPINLVANKVVIKTTGNESKGVYYMDFSDAEPIRQSDIYSTKLTTAAVNTSPSVSSPVKVEARNLGAFEAPSDKLAITQVSSTNKIQISSQSAQAIKEAGDSAGMVTIYNSGQLEGSLGLSSLVYSSIESPVSITNSANKRSNGDVYTRLATNDNITLQNTATIIGEYNATGRGAYTSKLTIATKETANSLNALSHAAMINKNTARNTFDAHQTTASGIIAMQNLSYVTTMDSKVSATKLLNKFSNLEKPSAIQVGYQIKNTILSGLDKASDYPDGMINIRANQNSIGKRLELRGNYVINSTKPYIDVSANENGAKMTGNITIYDAHSTKVYVNNTTISFEGDKAVSAINVVDTDRKTSKSVELSHIINANQYKLYDSSKTSDGNKSISLVGYTEAPVNAPKKAKLGA
jgi:hypothetical protein